MSTIVKAATAADFLGLVPTMLGFYPTESLVLVPFAGPRTIGVMRLDLPDTRTTEYREGASTMVGMVCKLDAADGVAIIAYSSERGHYDVEPLVNAVMARARECGLRLVDVLYVAADGWGSYVEGAEPRPLDELTITVVEGVSGPVGNQLAGANLPVIGEAQLAAIHAAVESFEPEFMSDPHLLFEALMDMDMDDLTGEMIAFLGFVLDRPAIRDVFLVQVTQGAEAGRRAVSAQLAWELGADYPEDIARHMWGEGVRPDPARLERALELSRITAVALPTGGAFATCGWLAWALGRSSQADRYAEQGLAIEPQHGLCEIVASFVHAGHLPEWAFSPKS